MRKLTFIIMLIVLTFTGSTSVAQSEVRAVVVNEHANIRIIPAIGAEVITTVDAGYLFDRINARSADNQWLRIDFGGNEGWVNIIPLSILSGDINTLPVANPVSIPYGGLDAPRSGFTSASSNQLGYLANSGIRVRSGPSTGYPVLANAPRFTTLHLLGRTASSTWVQVNFDGVLGWVTSQHVQISEPLSKLPIDGIVAEAPPMAEGADYAGTLKFMLERLDLAQISLDAIRASWSDSALTGGASCQRYPTRPSDLHIPNPILAAFYTTLNPLLVEFNDAMFNLRHAIDLFIEVCNQPGTRNPVGQATTIGALQTVALADTQFASIRRQLTELIPPDREIGDDECLFAFGGRADILPKINLGSVILDNFNPRRIVTGYCIDLMAGSTILIETLQLQGSNAVHLISLSLFDNPTNFLAVGRGQTTAPNLVLGPVLIQETGRYLLVLSNSEELEAPLQGEFALLVSLTTGIIGAQLRQDPATGKVVVAPPSTGNTGASPSTGNTGAPPFTGNTGAPPFTGNTGGNTGSVPPFLQTQTPPQFNTNPNTSTSGLPANTCPDITLTCQQMTTCDQARACLGAGNFALDPDDDGVPCENIVCPANQ